MDESDKEKVKGPSFNEGELGFGGVQSVIIVLIY